MRYDVGLAQAKQAGEGLAQTGEGPQLITRLGNQVRGLIELRSLLRGINKKLRGVQPIAENKSSDAPKPVELSLGDLTRDIELLLEECHSEASEASAVLS